MPNASRNPLPLTVPQLTALAHAAARQLTWGQRAVAREAATWRKLAEQIPDAPLRLAALSSLSTKRGHTDGAALFAILTARRSATLLRVLVAIEIIWDYLDSVHEHAPDERNGRQLHTALADAVDPDRPVSDWYRHHPCRNDGGYLAALVHASRMECRALPSFGLVQASLAQEMRRAQVLALNHVTDPTARDKALRRWADEEFPNEPDCAWYELSGAASASLVIHVLLALGADPDCTRSDVELAYAAYWPWVSLATTMLDSYVDRDEDAQNGDHSYIAHYPDLATALLRLDISISRSAHRILALRRGHSHAVILAAMIAMYLTKDAARSADARATSRALARAGGTLPTLLLPILRLWRVRYRQRAA